MNSVHQDATGKWLYRLTYSDLLLAPDGHTLLVSVPLPGPSTGQPAPALRLTAYDLDTGQTTPLAAQDVVRVQFSTDGDLAWLLSDHGRALQQLRLATGEVTTLLTLDQAFTTLDRAPDGSALVLGNLPRGEWEETFSMNGPCQVTLALGAAAPALPGVDASTAKQTTLDRCVVQYVPLAAPTASLRWVAPKPVRDLDFSPFRQEVVLTWSETSGGLPLATLAFYQPGLAVAVTEVTAPNCGDELVLAPDAGRAFLAPSSCQQDPISVFDLNLRRFETNLPGFGPVAMVGDKAVGFVRASDLAASWQTPLDTPYGLIVVDSHTLAWQVQPWGDAAPLFTAAPDGEHLLVWQDRWQAGSGARHSLDWLWNLQGLPSQLTRVRLADWQVTPVSNPSVRPDSFLWRPDGDTMLTLSAGWLFAVRVSDASVQHLPLAIAPELLQQRPNGEVLLGESDQPRVYRYQPQLGNLVAADVSLGAQVDASLSISPEPSQAWQQLLIEPAPGTPPATCAQSAQVDAVRLERWSGKAWLPVGTDLPVQSISNCSGSLHSMGDVDDGITVPVGAGLKVALASAHSGDRIVIVPLGAGAQLQARLIGLNVQPDPTADPVSQPFTGPMTWNLP